MKKVYFAGLDVHKNSIVMSIFGNEDEQPMFEKSFPGDGKKVLETLKRFQEKGDVESCYESGCMGFTLQRYLSKNGINCKVAAVSKIPRKPGERIKTDKRDARNLAKQLKCGEITAVHVPTETDEAVRDFVRARNDVKNDLKRTRQRLSKFLLRSDYQYEGVKNWTEKHRKWMKELVFQHKMQRETFESYYRHMEELEDRVREMEVRIEELSQSAPYRERVNHLRCLKGVDHLTALSFVVEIGDFRRFRNAESFMAYLGLVPCEHSSGSKRVQGSITKTGNGHLRRLLIESSWHYRHRTSAGKRLGERRKGQPSEVIAYADRAMRRLQKKFNRLVYRGKSSQTAVTAVARELSGFIWGLMVGNIA
jgi:transposase